ncbi:hypothetical protein AcdelDRAFT_4594, partial [Acidovorax delafieldii 2AN]
NTIRASGTVAAGTVGGYTASAVVFDGTTNNTLDLTAATVNGTVRAFGAGNTLSGDGTIHGALLLNNGKLAPGHSIGTITVVGTASLTGMTYNAEIDATTSTADLLWVMDSGPLGTPGTADVTGATLNVSNLSGTPAVGQTFTVLHTTAGITGTFTLGTLPAGVTSASLAYPLVGGVAQQAVLTITGVTPPPPAPGGAASIPTLSEWGVAALSLLLAGGMLWQRRRGRI